MEPFDTQRDRNAQHYGRLIAESESAGNAAAVTSYEAIRDRKLRQINELELDAEQDAAAVLADAETAARPSDPDEDVSEDASGDDAGAEGNPAGEADAAAGGDAGAAETTAGTTEISGGDVADAASVLGDVPEA